MRLVADLAESERRLAARRAPAPSEADPLRRELAELRVQLDEQARAVAMLSSRLEEETARRTRVERDLESARRQPAKSVVDKNQPPAPVAYDVKIERGPDGLMQRLALLPRIA